MIENPFLQLSGSCSLSAKVSPVRRAEIKHGSEQIPLLPYPPSVQSVQSLSRVWFLVTPWTSAWQAFLSITNSWSLPKPMSIESVMPPNHPILCHPLLLPSIFPSIRVFSNESALRIRWPKYWLFSFSISPSNEHPGLISFRMGWLVLLAVQGTLKSLLQHHSPPSLPALFSFLLLATKYSGVPPILWFPPLHPEVFS